MISLGCHLENELLLGKRKSRQTKIKRLLPILKAENDGPGGSGPNRRAESTYC